jgi:hypothetical protein
MDLYFQALLLLVLLLLIPLHLHSQTLIPKTRDLQSLQAIPQTIPLTVQEMIQSDQTENPDLGDLEWVRGVRDEQKENQTRMKNQTRKNSWSLKWTFALKGVSPDAEKSEPICWEQNHAFIKSGCETAESFSRQRSQSLNKHTPTGERRRGWNIGEDRQRPKKKEQVELSTYGQSCLPSFWSLRIVGLVVRLGA